MLWGNRNLIKDEKLIICSLPVAARSRGDKEEIKGRGAHGTLLVQCPQHPEDMVTRRAALTMLHLLGETTALLKQAGVFSLGSSETRFCRRRSWRCCMQGVRLAKGLLVGSWPSNTGIIQEQGSGEQEVACVSRRSFTAMVLLGITALLELIDSVSRKILGN